MDRYFPEGLFIEKGLDGSALVRNVLASLPDEIPVKWIDSPGKVAEPFGYAADPLSEGKRQLLISRNRGAFFQPCPGTPRYLCCLYKILNFSTNCSMECSYCILQGYLDNPVMVVFGNIDDMFEELAEVFAHHRDRVIRLGTGEFTDSLVLEHLTHFTRILLPLINNWPNVFLELKTKTDNIEPLLGLSHNGQVITSWSLNTPRIIEQEEWGTARLEERLGAAYRCQQQGYPVAFHFDPIIYYPGWERDYHEVINQLFAQIDPDRIVWISLGTLRFPPALKPLIKQRFPDNRLLGQELVRGGDGKVRYFRPIRIKIYQQLIESIRALAPEVQLYLCMESEAVWKRAMGFSPRDNYELSELLNQACLKVCARKSHA